MNAPSRLDGWKAIAAYLGRDERTAQRWRERGLPVHAAPGARRGTVFAFPAEIDQWLSQLPLHDNGEASEATAPGGGAAAEVEAGPAPVAQEPIAATAETVATTPWTRTFRSLAIVAAATIIAVIAVVGFRSVNSPSAGGASRIERATITADGLVAWKADGHVAFLVPSANLIPPDVAELSPAIGSRRPPLVSDLDGDGTPEVITSVQLGLGRVVASTEVRSYSASGELRWRYRPERRLRFGKRVFDGPWTVLDQVAVREDNGRARVWLAVGHAVWWPSFVVSLDSTGAERVHLVQSGHVYRLQEIETPVGLRVFAVGVNNEHKAAALTALDPDRSVVSPQQQPDYTCTDCVTSGSGPAEGPYLTFPQTEVSRSLGRPYNLGWQLRISGAAAQLDVVELPASESAGHLYSHYRLSPNLEPQAMWVSDGYWVVHRRLEARGQLRHSVDDCPERKGVNVRVWTGAGWKEVWVPNEGAPF